MTSGETSPRGESAVLSIVTVSRNHIDGLMATVQSVLNQTAFGAIDYLVIDGLSSDGTVQYLASINCSPRSFVYSSEADLGVYDAMNKGLARAIGDYVLFLNAGDVLADSDVIEKVLAKLPVPAQDWAVARIVDLGGGTAGCTSNNLPFSVTRFFWARQVYCHQGTIFGREALLALGGYSITSGYAADAEAMFRLGQVSAPLELDMTLSIYEGGGISAGKSRLSPVHFHRFRVRHFRLNGVRRLGSYIIAFLQVTKRSLTATQSSLGLFVRSWLRRK